MSILAENRKAYFNYQILETLEAGIELTGHEVKGIKTGKANLAGAFATVHDNQIWLTNMTVEPYQPKNAPPGYEPARPRRLLLKKSEIAYLTGKHRAERLTVIPLKLYTKGGLVKVELGLARGKRQYEKRETIKKRESQREIKRTLKRG